MMQDIDLHDPRGVNAYNNSRNSSKRKNMYLYGGIFCLLLVGVIVAVAVVVSGGGDDSRSADNTELVSQMQATLEREGLAPEPLTAQGTYQYKAFEWLKSNSQLESYDHTQRVQRYALACFYFATNQVANIYTEKPEPWVSDEGWLSDNNECQWDGVTCSTRLRVSGINLEDNKISGFIPPELALMKEHLKTIDLTTNLIYMEGEQLNVFAKLTKLETLLMDDNFLSSDDGLPTSFGQLTDIQKIRLSYNLFGGPIDGAILANMTKLTHLEIESNFFTGNFPAELGNMPELVYIYLRRNSFRGDLEFLKEGGLPNLFALWLDANRNIEGTIPTEVGLLTDLASMSITNCTLSGNIPTELGNLGGLRRLWLYGNLLEGTVPTELGQLSLLEVFEVQSNSLTGEMPEGVCTTLEASVYERKSLEADCKEITCPCCTKCYEDETRP